MANTPAQDRDLLGKIRTSKRILRVCCIVISIVMLIQIVTAFILHNFLPLIIVVALTVSIVASYVTVSKEEQKVLARLNDVEF